MLVSILLATAGYAFDKYDIEIPFHIESSLYASFFYISGCLAYQRICDSRTTWGITALLFACNILLSQCLPGIDIATNHCGWYGLNAMDAYVGTLAIFLLSKKLDLLKEKNVVRRFLLWAGSNTIVVLGLSQVLSRSIKIVLGALPMPSAVNSVLRHVVLWCLLWLCAWLLNKYLPVVIGKSKK